MQNNSLAGTGITETILSDRAGNINSVHFTGIGGISMSGLAEILAVNGYNVTGSDVNISPITKKLNEKGIKVTIGHSAENVAGADLLVYTAAVNSSNPELAAAIEKGIPIMNRATLLGRLMKSYPKSIAVSGTHGKTTVTSMIAMILLEEGLDPTIHIGGILDDIGGTTRIGKSDYFVTEADEYTGSFLKFNPYLAVILNIEYDHPDFFKDFQHIKNAFQSFAGLVPGDGYLLASGDDPSALDIFNRADSNKATFGFNSELCTFSASDIVFDDMGCASYTLLHHKESVARIGLKVPGMHNVSNSLAAAAACSLMGCSIGTIAEALQKFKGTHRRFELKGSRNGITVIDDYAHHPTEVATTLKAARQCLHSRIWCVFQPHTYTRTRRLMNEFSKAFEDADTVILADIFAAREVDTGEVNSGMLADRISGNGKQAIYIKGMENIAGYLYQNAIPGDIIITMGAGDIYKAGELFLNITASPASDLKTG